MSDTDKHSTYQALADEMVAKSGDVAHGKMMSSPALTCGGKVFVFFTGQKEMGFRLGRDYDFATLPDGAWSHLAPFKTKPPMVDWVVIGTSHAHLWPELAHVALDLMQTAQGQAAR